MLAGIEEELFVFTKGVSIDAPASELLSQIQRQQEGVPAIPIGWMTDAGRIYFESRHCLEIATPPRSCPFAIQEDLAALRQMVLEAAPPNWRINNASTLSGFDNNFVGHHESFSIPRGEELCQRTLAAFFASSLFLTGAGHVRPNGEFVASARAEAVADGRRQMFRFRDSELISSESSLPRLEVRIFDAKRNGQINALGTGITMMVVELLANSSPIRELLTEDIRRYFSTALDGQDPRDPEVLHEFNALSRGGNSLQVSETAVQLQRIFLAAVLLHRESQSLTSSWQEYVLDQWATRLDEASGAIDSRCDLADFDAIRKWVLINAYVNERSISFSETHRHADVLREILLLAHDYHDLDDSSLHSEFGDALPIECKTLDFEAPTDPSAIARDIALNTLSVNGSSITNLGWWSALDEHCRGWRMDSTGTWSAWELMDRVYLPRIGDGFGGLDLDLLRAMSRGRGQDTDPINLILDPNGRNFLGRCRTRGLTRTGFLLHVLGHRAGRPRRLVTLCAYMAVLPSFLIWRGLSRIRSMCLGLAEAFFGSLRVIE